MPKAKTKRLSAAELTEVLSDLRGNLDSVERALANAAVSLGEPERDRHLFDRVRLMVSVACTKTGDAALLLSKLAKERGEEL